MHTANPYRSKTTTLFPSGRWARLSLLAAAMGAAGLLVSACGGGAGAGGTSANEMGHMTLAVTDAPGLDFDKAFVTIKELRIHQLDSAGSEDGGWHRFTLPEPVTVDLASLNNGAMANVFNDVTLPVGNYKQIRIVLADSDDALTASAQAKGLQTNNEIQYSAAGATKVAPLEIAYPIQGITLLGNFSVSTDKTLRLLVDFDIGHDIVRFRHGGQDGFTMKPILHYFDLDAAGAIVGQVDTSACAALSTPCTDFVIKAESTGDSGSAVRRVVRATSVKPDGSFVLYPVPAGANYDVLVRGRYTQTMVVKGVPSVAGSTPTSQPALVSAAALPLAGAPEYTANLTPAANPTGGWVQFYQTATAGEPAYEVRFRHQNPFTGTFYTDEALVNAPLMIGNYVAAGNPSFTSVTPVEGAGSYRVQFDALGFTQTDAGIIAPGSGSPVAVTPPTLTPASNVAQLGTVSGNIALLTPNHWTTGQIVVARLGTIVNTIDISAQLAGGGAFSVSNLPAGSTSKPLPTGFYYAYARVSNPAINGGRVRVIPLPGFADLRRTGAATLNVTLP